MDRKYLNDVLSNVSEYRDAAENLVTSYYQLLLKLVGDASEIEKKNEGDRTDDEKAVYSYYKNELHSYILDVISHSQTYNEGTKKYITALEKAVESYKDK